MRNAKLLSLSSCILALLLECGCNNNNSNPPQTSMTNGGGANGLLNESTNVAQNSSNPRNQGQTDADRALSQKIRSAIESSTNNYSTADTNVTISTVNGKVTLSGEVSSSSQKTGIESIADSVAGNDNVKDQITVR